ncbi:MAG TPA: PQQ-dependent sugar dehydrogenase [Gemmatimonadales bacterium]|nr:PQQ-dependent sugar dehydrogenase [Gemmatimonadales bacterium]
MTRPSLVLLLVAATAEDARAQQALPRGGAVDTVARGLGNPWGLGFLPDGRLILSERGGIVSTISPGGGPPVRWITLPVAPTGAGLLGLAVAPDFTRSRRIYLFGVYYRDPPRDSALEGRIHLLRDSAGSGVVERLLLGGLPSARSHAGGVLAFGPDGHLYVTVGDGFVPPRAADPDSLGGKILRLTPEGGVPRDNPRPGSPVHALGFRNPQGIAWEPESDALFATEHGPTDWPWEEGRRDHDELNQVRPGGDYGWPGVAGRGGTAAQVEPLVDWTPAIAPSGAAFYAGRYAAWRGQLFVGALRGRHLRRIRLAREDGRWRIVEEEPIVADSTHGRIRGVFMGPDGHLYLATSNRVTGPARAPDDLLLRLRLPGEP